MKRVAIYLTDDLRVAIERYRRDDAAGRPISGLARAAIHEYPARLGDASETEEDAFSITPAARGSGAGDVSVRHDEYSGRASATDRA